jgi:hypothetical protein
MISEDTQDQRTPNRPTLLTKEPYDLILNYNSTQNYKYLAVGLVQKLNVTELQKEEKDTHFKGSLRKFIETLRVQEGWGGKYDPPNPPHTLQIRPRLSKPYQHRISIMFQGTYTHAHTRNPSKPETLEPTAQKPAYGNDRCLF